VELHTHIYTHIYILRWITLITSSKPLPFTPPYAADGTTYAAAPAAALAAPPAAARTIVDGPPPAPGRPGHPMI
jgi:hypothetical protein